MNKTISLLPRMAANNIRKNGQVYFPYIGASIFAIFTYFVFDLIIKNDFMYTLPKAAYTIILISIGFSLLGIILIPFLSYTNSFLIKRRKKELGLYSILGLEKKHIGLMMFYESVIMYVIVLTAAILLGLIFSRLLFVLLLNLAKLPVEVKFQISPGAIMNIIIYYAFITVLNLFVNLIQVGKSNPVELMRDTSRCEKEPKLIGLWSLVGTVALLLGYRMAVNAQFNRMIFTDFFSAVFLVVIGTYFLFTSGSIAILRFLKKRKKFYYRPDNFITVSGMLYRMKKSAASLANICIFSTMVIITVVCTVSVYLGMNSILSSGFTREFELYYIGNERVDGNELKEGTAKLAAQEQVTLRDELSYSYVKAKIYLDGDTLKREGDPYDYSGWKDLLMMTQEEYNLLEGTQETLQPNEILLFSEGADFGADSIWFEDQGYSVHRELQESKLTRKLPENNFAKLYLAVFANRDELNRVSQLYGVDGFQNVTYFYGFLPEGTEANIDSFSRNLETYANELSGFAQYKDYRDNMKDQESTYGGLLFIGIFFGSIFLICLLIIMYYKQISEGFEDQKNFEIMQKVGMGDGEIRRTIKKQISMVFILPLVAAIFHTIVGIKMVYMLLGAIGFFEKELLNTCTVGGCLIFAIVYGLSYFRTSMAYYRIVKQMN